MIAKFFVALLSVTSTLGFSIAPPPLYAAGLQETISNVGEVDTRLNRRSQRWSPDARSNQTTIVYIVSSVLKQCRLVRAKIDEATTTCS
jgi:hypothetical protein